LFGPELALTFFPSFAMLFEGKKYRVFTLDHRGEERSRLSFRHLLMRGGQGSLFPACLSGTVGSPPT
jgi:hypothetical protein